MPASVYPSWPRSLPPHTSRLLNMDELPPWLSKRGPWAGITQEQCAFSGPSTYGIRDLRASGPAACG